MLSSRVRPERDEGTGSWEFSAIGAPLPRDQVERQRHALESALGAAAGLRLQLVLTWSTGCPPRISLRGEGAGLARWVDQVLAAGYTSGRWHFHDAASVSSGWILMRSGVPLDRTAAAIAEPDPDWSEPVVVGLPAIPRGLEARWTLDSAEPSRPQVGLGQLANWLSTPAEQGRPTRRRPDGPRPAGSLPAALPHPWRMSLTVRASSPRALPWVPRFERLIAATTRTAGFALGFRPGGRRPKHWVTTSRVVTGLFPSSEVRCPSGPSGLEGSRYRWAVGTTPTARPVHLPYVPGEGRHLAVLGETGMGKSSLLLRLTREATQVANVVLVDPIGDTAERFVESLDDSVASRVVVVSPTNPSCTFNAVHPGSDASERRPHDQGHAVGDLVTALRRVRHQRYVDSSFWGPRIEDALYRVLNAVERLPHGTLIDAMDLLEGRVPRSSGFQADDAQRLRLVAEWASERPQDVDGARRLLAEVVGAPALRGLLANPNPTWSLDDVESQGRITVIDGQAGIVGESVARCLTTVLVALLWGRLLGRSPNRKMCVVLDEAQWYAHEAIAEALRVSRRLNVHVWLATQSLDSLPEGTRESASTNIADWALFRGAGSTPWLFRRPPAAFGSPSARPLAVGEALWVRSKGASLEEIRVFASSSVRSNPGRSEGDRSSQSVVRLTEAPRSTCGSAPRTPRPPSPDELRIHFTDLSSGDSGGDRMLRTLGGQLGRRGWIRGYGEDERGRYWNVSSEARPTLERAGVLIAPSPSTVGRPAVGPGPPTDSARP